MPKCRKRKLEDILMKFKSLKQLMPFQINKKLPKKIREFVYIIKMIR